MLNSRLPVDFSSCAMHDTVSLAALGDFASSPASVCRSQAALKRRCPSSSAVVFDVMLNGDHVYVVVEEDLVKSHLLLAVREEVDVLKASIGSLMERISSLERENAALRGCVSADVLVQAEHLRRGGSVTSRPAAATVSCSSPSSCTSPTQHTSGGTTCACVAGSPSDGACSASTATQHQQTQQR